MSPNDKPNNSSLKVAGLAVTVTLAVCGAMWTLARELMVRPTADDVNMLLKDAQVEIRRELRSAQEVQGVWVQQLNKRQDELSSKLDSILDAVRQPVVSGGAD